MSSFASRAHSARIDADSESSSIRRWTTNSRQNEHGPFSYKGTQHAKLTCGVGVTFPKIPEVRFHVVARVPIQLALKPAQHDLVIVGHPILTEHRYCCVATG